MDRVRRVLTMHYLFALNEPEKNRGAQLHRCEFAEPEILLWRGPTIVSTTKF